MNRAGIVLILLSTASACGGTAVEVDPEPGASGGGPPGMDGSGGETFLPFPSTGGNGTGGEPFMEDECPDVPPPEPVNECDPIDPEGTCGFGLGCFPFLEYPFGERCGFASSGTICAAAGVAEQGERCGDGLGLCAPGYMCVVGAAGGKRCGQICEPVRDHECPDGLVCGETDVQGYGVCF